MWIHYHWLYFQPQNKSYLLKVGKVFKVNYSILLFTLYNESPMQHQPEYPFLKTLKDGSTLTYEEKIQINVFCCVNTKGDTHAKVIEKFLQGNYGVDAHRCMASQKHAPRMLSFENVTSIF